MRKVLEGCRRINGRADLVEARPGLRRVADALYVPFPEAGWGLHEAAPQGLRRIDAANPGAGPPPEALARAETAPEADYLYIGAMTDHYGHFVTDTLSRLWPLLDRPAGTRPRLVYHAPDRADLWRGLDFLTVILGRLGLGVDDLVGFDRPVRLPCVLVPEPGFVGEACGHHAYRDLCRHVGRGLWDPAAVDSVARPVYLSKLRLRGGFQKVENEAELVDALERLGVETVFPETMSFADQVDLLARRRTILALTGSALHTALFSAPGRRILGLNWNDFLNPNHLIVDGLNGNRARYYHPRGAPFRSDAEHMLIWTIPEPRRVARELLARQAELDRARPGDAAAWVARPAGAGARLAAGLDRLGGAFRAGARAAARALTPGGRLSP